jgi:hypothetical protein
MVRKSLKTCFPVVSRVASSTLAISSMATLDLLQNGGLPDAADDGHGRDRLERSVIGNGADRRGANPWWLGVV